MRRKVFGAKLPDKEFKRIWAKWVKCGVWVQGWVNWVYIRQLGSLSSATRRKALEAQQCPLGYRLSQVKHNPRSRWKMGSSNVKGFTMGGKDGGGDGKRGESVMGRGGGGMIGGGCG